MNKPLTVASFMVDLMTGLSAASTDVVQVCLNKMGFEHTSPWLSKMAMSAAVLVTAAILEQPEQAVLLMGIVGAEPAGIRALREKAASIHASLKALNDKAVAAATAGGPALTDEDRASVTALKAEFETVEGLRVDAVRLNEAERNAPVAPDPDAKAAAAAAPDVKAGTLRSELDPGRGFADHREMLQDVMNAGMTGRVSEKLRPLQATQGSDEQGAYSDPAGGFLIPRGVAPGLLTTAAESDFIAPLVTNISPMTAPTVAFNARVDKNHTTSVSGGFTVSRRPETVDGTSSRVTFEQVILTANEEFGLAYATERILSDSPQSFVAIISAGFTDEFANNAISERLNGTGVGERGGILHANNGSLITVAKETGQAAATIVKENIDAMAARCWRYGSAVWIANQSTRPQLRSLVQVIGTGGNPVPYFLTSGGQETLDGRPIYFTEHAKNLGTVGDLVLANWSQYLEGEYQGMQQAESIHVRFVSAERAFRFYKRNDGRTWWRSALTPKNSAPTLSPFLTLATRA